MSTKTNSTKATSEKTDSLKTNRGTKSIAGYSEQNTPLGGCILADTPITFNENKPVTKVKVRNTGDRPIQVGSHFHFFEANRALEFDRAAAYGKKTEYLFNHRHPF